MSTPPPVTPLPDPGPRPPLSGERLLVWMAAHQLEVNEAIRKMDERGMGFVRSYERHARWAHWLMVGEVTLMVGSRLSAIFIASYIAYEHTWYVEKIMRWIHGAF